MVGLVVVDGDKDSTVVAEQLVEQAQARVDHAKPFIVAGQIVAANLLGEPRLKARVVYVVVVDPALVASIVGRGSM